MTEVARMYGKLCFEQSSCNNCPIRKECILRERFYAEGFEEYLENIFTKRKEENLRAGRTLLEAEIFQDIAKELINLKREKEILMHPTYEKD